MSVAESTSQQSDVLWRNKRKRCGSNTSSNNDEPLAVVSTIQPHHHPATSKHSASSSRSSRRQQQRWAPLPKRSAVYVTLAAESPARSADDSEDSLYDSFHGRETDVCRDTSDTDSYDTDGFATMDVIEYEVPSGSTSNSDLYSHDSSSGTDDFVLTAAQLARAIFTKSSSAGVPRRSGSDTTSGETFELLADTEESDGPTDPELGRADYWTCVKCKNKQNNPMYRYCERCYQIRKTHFPPRPQLRKTRSSPAKHRSSPSSRGKFKLCSSSSSSGSDTDDLATEGGGSRSPHLNRRNRKSQHLPRTRVDRSYANSTGDNSAASSHSDVAADSDNEPGQPTCSEERLNNAPIRNKFLSNVCRDAAPPPPPPPTAVSRAPPDQLSIASTRDSGFQSSCGSSADMSPDVAPPSLAHSSQETFCSDLEDGSCQLSATPLASTVGSISTVSTASTASSILNGTHAIRSISSCSTQHVPSDEHAGSRLGGRKRRYSDTESGSSLAPKLARSQAESELDLTLVPAGGAELAAAAEAAAAAAASGIDSSYGLCMMCLTQPKNGVFVHSRFVHLCCCYRCAVKVWNKQKRCPICNCKIKNVMKLFVH